MQKHIREQEQEQEQVQVQEQVAGCKDHEQHNNIDSKALTGEGELV